MYWPNPNRGFCCILCTTPSSYLRLCHFSTLFQTNNFFPHKYFTYLPLFNSKSRDSNLFGQPCSTKKFLGQLLFKRNSSSIRRRRRRRKKGGRTQILGLFFSFHNNFMLENKREFGVCVIQPCTRENARKQKELFVVVCLSCSRLVHPIVFVLQ